MFSLSVFISVVTLTSSAIIPAPENLLSTRILTITRKTRMAMGYIQDAYLNFTELATKYGYQVDAHTVTSEDGHLLQLFRIPMGRNSTVTGPPVLMMHGFLDSSDSWIVPGPGYGLGYKLADAGYDVWCANFRGNKYSRKHMRLDPDKDVKFWKFSYDEMGRYDLPAITDYILNLRRLPTMNYVGFSQGTTVFYTMGASKPDYYKKYDLMISLAPVSWLTHLFNPYMRTIVRSLPQVEALLNTIGLQEIFANSSVYSQSLEVLCHRVKVNKGFCTNLLFLLMGDDPEQLREELLPVFYGHVPCGASLQNLMHLGQGVGNRKFQRMNHGVKDNLRVYGSSEPPEYNISLVTTPVAIMYGRNDWLSAPKDVAKLRKRLPNVVDNYLVPKKKWQHTDHVYGKDAPRLIGDRMIKLLNTYSSHGDIQCGKG